MCGPGATLVPLRCFPVLLASSAAQFQWLLFRVPSPPPPGKGLAGSPVTPGFACAGLHLWAYPEVGEGHSHVPGVDRDVPTCVCLSRYLFLHPLDLHPLLLGSPD